MQPAGPPTGAFASSRASMIAPRTIPLTAVPPAPEAIAMAHVITQPCIGVKDASCVEVCPVDRIHSDDTADMYYIDPDECIDCGACVDPCPVDAIHPEDEVPAEWTEFIKINANYFQKASK